MGRWPKPRKVLTGRAMISGILTRRINWRIKGSRKVDEAGMRICLIVNDEVMR
jgi:hypothetical protein